MANSMPLPLADYQRVYQVIYSVLSAAEGRAHRACSFFIVVGTVLLRDHYKLDATISAGIAVYKLDQANVLCFGRAEGEEVVGDADAYHAWVEVDGYAIDFMAPLFADVVQEEGLPRVPRRMFQKPLSEMKTLDGLSAPGDFTLQHDKQTASAVVDHFGAVPAHLDLMKVCQAWFQRPPKPLRPMAMGDSLRGQVKLTLRAPAIEGVW